MGILISVFKNYLKYRFDINTPSWTRTTPQQMSQPYPLKIEHSRNKSNLEQKILVTQNFFCLNFTSHYILEFKWFSWEAECALFSHVRISHEIKCDIHNHCEIWPGSQRNHLPGLTRPPFQRWNSLPSWQQHRAHKSSFFNEWTEVTSCLWWY